MDEETIGEEVGDVVADVVDTSVEVVRETASRIEGVLTDVDIWRVGTTVVVANLATIGIVKASSWMFNYYKEQWEDRKIAKLRQKRIEEARRTEQGNNE